MTRGRRGSLALRRRALPSPPPCRFIPALSQDPAQEPPAPPCATSNPAAKPSRRSPASSAHPAAGTKSFLSLHSPHQCRSAATSLDLRPVLRGPPHRRGPAARGGTPRYLHALWVVPALGFAGTGGILLLGRGGWEQAGVLGVA